MEGNQNYADGTEIGKKMLKCHYILVSSDDETEGGRRKMYIGSNLES